MLTERLNVNRLVRRHRIPPSSALFGNSPVFVDGHGKSIRVPVTPTDFTALGVVAPSSLWLCQEASGNLTDSIGGITLTENGSPLYQQAVSPWFRFGLGFNQTAAQRFSVAAGSGPNPAATSVAWFCYFLLSGTPAASRRLLTAADGLATTGVLTTVTTSGTLTLTCVAVGATGSYDYRDSLVHPLLMVYDRTNSTVVSYTDKEAITGTYNAGAVDAAKGLASAGSGTSLPGNILWAAAASGATAESYGKHTLNALGWPLAY